MNLKRALVLGGADEDEEALWSIAAAAQSDESGRKIATKVKTWEPSSGTLVVYWRIEKIAMCRSRFF